MALVVVSIVKMQNRKCSDIQVNINYDGKYPTLDRQSISSLLEKEEIPIIGIELKKISLKKISEELKKNDFIKKVEKINFNGTKLAITVRLKTLLLHIYPEKGDQFFMDDEGGLLPFSPLVKEKVMIANGTIKRQFTSNTNVETDSTHLKTLYQVALAIRKNSFCSAQFCQIYINKNQEIELIPALGQHIVKIGKGDRIEEKLSDIESVYINALAYKEMDRYKELDVRFQNRVIAKQR